MVDGVKCNPGVRERRRWLDYELPLAIYVIAGVMVAVRQRNDIHNDVVAYVRRAMYLAQGDFYHAISSYWSPMISWCITPLVYMGMDGLYAARAVCCAWGAVLVVTFAVFLKALATFGRGWRLATTCVVALIAVQVSGDSITPDVILGACLFAYLAAACSATLMQRRGTQLAAGLLGGVAYLGKAYAFPFVLVHMPLTLALRAFAMWRSGEGGSGPIPRRQAIHRAMGALVVFIVGFVIVAGPWIGILTWRYGRVTYSSVGAAAHALVGPRADRKVFEPFMVPEDPYIIAWENPEMVHHGYWSPLEGWREFVFQLSIIQRQATAVWQTVWRFDSLHLGGISIAAAAVGVVVAARLATTGLFRPSAEQWKTPWLLMTMAVYCSGFLPIYFAPRYIMAIVLPLSLVLCLKLAMELPAVMLRMAGTAGGVVRMCARIALAVVVLGSFGHMGGQMVYKELRNPSTKVYRQIGDEIKRRGLKGAIASNDRVRTFNLALHVGEKFVGFPADDDLDLVDRKLRECDTGILIVWQGETRRGESSGSAKRAPELARRASWRYLFSSHGADVYAPTWSLPQTTRPATAPLDR
jgi:hypothetical protein